MPIWNIHVIFGYRSPWKNVKFIATSTRQCQGNYECTGYYVDPIKASEDERKFIFEGDFPEDMHGSYVYFFDERNFELYKKIINL